jgi:protein TonB
METKKNPRADLTLKRGLFIQIGLAVVVGLLLVAINWTTKIRNIDHLGHFIGNEIFEDVMVTKPEEKIVPPPPMPKQAVVDVITIIDKGQESNLDKIVDLGPDYQNPMNIPVVAQEVPIEEPEVLICAEQGPEFPGGEAELFRYLRKNIRYPEIAKTNNIQGRVFLQFVVDSQGNITRIKVLRSVDPFLDAEAIRVVQNMPKWKPGVQGGKNVHVAFTLPVNFVLRD